MMLVLYCVMPIDARTTISVRTTSSSMSVKPRSVQRRLPGFVLGAIECCSIEGRVHVKDVLAAPSRGVGLVLIGAQAPLGAARHRIDGNAAQELELASRRIVRRRHAVDERLQIGRIVLAPDLDVERA